MQPNNFLKINAPDVVHETIDGETILLNLRSGTYYSMDKDGAAVWALIENGCTIAGISEIFAKYYQISQKKTQQQISPFLAELIENKLVIEVKAATREVSRSEGRQLINELLDGKVQLSQPVLNKYDDMQDLLLLDPIHEVGDEGWPSVEG